MSAITEDMCNLPTIDTVLLDQNALMSVPESVTRLRVRAVRLLPVSI